MPRLFVWFQRCVAALALLWALFTGATFLIQLPHREIVEHKAQHYTDQQLYAAIASYDLLNRWITCYHDMAHVRSRLYLKASERALRSGALEQSHEFLTIAINATKDQLACRPHDGKAWLDYMLLLSEQSGFNQEALNAFKQSHAVTPHEAWLNEKRLLFTLIFMPMFDVEALKMAQADSDSLQRALGGRHLKFYKKSGLKSFDQLNQILAEAIAYKQSILAPKRPCQDDCNRPPASYDATGSEK